MTTTTEPRRDALTGRPLRNVEALAIQMLIEEIEEAQRAVPVARPPTPGSLSDSPLDVGWFAGAFLRGEVRAGSGQVSPTLPCRDGLPAPNAETSTGRRLLSMACDGRNQDRLSMVPGRGRS
jgi:hypothetical protein